MRQTIKLLNFGIITAKLLLSVNVIIHLMSSVFLFPKVIT